MRCFTDPEMQAAFERDGYIIVDFLDQPAVDRLMDVHAREHEAQVEGFHASMLLDDSEAYRARVDAALKAEFAPRIEALVDDFRVFHCSFAVKGPRSEASRVDLHQDITFVDERSHTALNIWCPLMDLGPENGWLYVVKGSHRFNHGMRPPTGLLYPDLMETLEDHYLTYLPLRAGQALLMHPCTFHGSVPNASDRPRVVAAGVAAPREAQLFYCHQDWDGDPNLIEIYTVEESFYLTHVVGQRPREGTLIGTVPLRVEALDEHRLAEVCGPLLSGPPDPKERISAFQLPPRGTPLAVGPRQQEVADS